MNKIRIILASPGDVKTEREILPRIIEDLNKGIASDRGLILDLIRWETDAYPGFHHLGPQGQIESSLRIEDSDLLIGVFWKRFGTPTLGSKSGTEHEFRRAYEAWKKTGRPNLLIYFCERSYAPQSIDELDQWREVLNFKKNFPKEGLWWSYKNKTDFERNVRNHLTKFVLTQP